MTKAPDTWLKVEHSGPTGWALARWPEAPTPQVPNKNWCWAAVAAAIGFERPWTQAELAERLAPFPARQLSSHENSLKKPRPLGVALDVVGATADRRELDLRDPDAVAQVLRTKASALNGRLAMAISVDSQSAAHFVAIHGYHPASDHLLVWDPRGDRTGTWTTIAVAGWDVSWWYWNADELGV